MSWPALHDNRVMVVRGTTHRVVAVLGTTKDVAPPAFAAASTVSRSCSAQPKSWPRRSYSHRVMVARDTATVSRSRTARSTCHGPHCTTPRVMVVLGTTIHDCDSAPHSQCNDVA